MRDQKENGTMKRYGFGVDIGGTSCKLGIFETTGILLEKWEIPTDTSDEGENILSDIASSIKNKMEEQNISKEEIEGIGIGLPGPVRSDGVVPVCVNLGWKNKNVAEELGEMMGGMKVRVANDANVAALGEMWEGGGRGCKSLVMITLGTGVGGGIIIDDRIVTGNNGAGGEVGHITVNPHETVPCNCGRKGCLEQYASATGIVRLARKHLAGEHEASLLDELGEISAKEIFDMYKDGDQTAEDIVEEFAEILGGALSNLACILDPEVFVIGGGVSKAGKPLLDVIEKYYRKAAFSSCDSTRFALATLGNDAGMYGCVKLILE